MLLVPLKYPLKVLWTEYIKVYECYRKKKRNTKRTKYKSGPQLTVVLCVVFPSPSPLWWARKDSVRSESSWPRRSAEGGWFNGRTPKLNLFLLLDSQTFLSLLFSSARPLLLRTAGTVCVSLGNRLLLCFSLFFPLPQKPWFLNLSSQPLWSIWLLTLKAWASSYTHIDEMLQQCCVRHTPASGQPDNSSNLPSHLFFFFSICPHKCCFYSVLVVNSYICSLGSGDGNVTVFINQSKSCLRTLEFQIGYEVIRSPHRLLSTPLSSQFSRFLWGTGGLFIILNLF